MDYFLNFVLGSVLGSFVGALSYRLPRGISINRGRSICPKCKKKIGWYDNIPILSYFILSGKCRNCGKAISKRYPNIEIATGVLFVLSYFSLNNCALSNQGAICDYASRMGMLTLPFFAVITILLVSIFVTDFEHKVISDELVFIGIGLLFLIFLVFGLDKFFTYLFVGLSSSLFFLILNLITGGRGMGLGDVKFAIFGGMLIGWPLVLVWLFLSFLIGSVVGILLILIGKAEFGKHVAFGPFLIISLFLVLFWGNALKEIIFVGLNF